MNTNLNTNENATQEVAAPRMARVNYLADIQYTALSADYHKSIKKILRTTGVDDAMVCQEITDPRRLALIERDVFADYDGVYLTYTVEATKEGLEEIHQVLVQGRVFNNPRFTPGLVKAGYGNTRFYVGAMTAGDDRVTFYMSPMRQDLYKALGIRKPGKDLIKENKRNRRGFANGELTFKGRILSEEKASWNISLGEDQGTIAMTVYTIEFDRAFQRANPVEILRSYTAKVGVLNFNKSSFLDRKILSLTDGAHIIDPGWFNLMTASMGLPMEMKYKGDGMQFTLDSRAGQGKGNAVFGFLADLDMLMLDTKPEFFLSDDRVRLSLNSIHAADRVCTDVQSAVNGMLDKINVFGEAGALWIDEIKEAIGNDAKMRELLGICPDDLDTTGEWVLKNFLMLTRKNLLDINGQPLSIWYFPGLAKKALRFLTEQLVDITRVRVPLPRNWAAAGYAMLDISILEHADSKLSGRGFYLESAALPAMTASLMTTTDLGFNVTFADLWAGEVVIHRQPNGTGREWVRGVHLVKTGFYAELRTSPFLFMSVQVLDFTNENTQLYAEMMLGKDKFAELVELWGEMIPSIVYWLAVMGGGDLDDRIVVYLKESIVKHLNEIEQALYDYPEGQFTTRQEMVQSVRRHSEILQNRMGQLAHTMTPVFNMIKATTTGGLIGQLSNVAMIFNTLYYAGKLDGIDTSVAAFIRQLEAVVDNDKMGKGSSMVVEAGKAIAKFFEEVSQKSIPQYLVNRLPRKFRAEAYAAAYVSPMDRQLAELAESVQELKTVVLDAYVSRRNTQILDILYGCPVAAGNRQLAQEIRKDFISVLKTERAEIARIYEDSKFANVDDLDKDIVVTMQSMTAADAQITSQLSEYPVQVQREVALALYQQITDHEYRDPQTGVIQPVSDAMLFGPGFHKIFMDAVQYAYDFSNGLIPTPPPVQPEAEVSADLNETTNTFTVVNGMSKKSEEEVAVFQAEAQDGIAVYAESLSAEDAFMRTGKVDPAVMIRRISDDSVYGFIAARELSQFMAGYGEPVLGQLMPHPESQYAALFVC